jgi:hypothetical protein
MDKHFLIDSSLADLVERHHERALGLWLRLACASVRTRRSHFDPGRFVAFTGRHLRQALPDLVDLAVLGLVALERGVDPARPTIHVRTWKDGGLVDPVSGASREPSSVRAALGGIAVDGTMTKLRRRAAKDRRRKRRAREVRQLSASEAILDALRPFTAAERTRLWRMKSSGVPPIERALLVAHARRGVACSR